MSGDSFRRRLMKFRRPRLLVAVLAGALLAGLALAVISLQRSQFDVARIEQLGGRVLDEPTWFSRLPEWLQLGKPQRFARIVGIDFASARAGRVQIVELLNSLRGSERVKILRLGGHRLRDEDLNVLRRYPSLRELDLSSCPVSDVGLTHLRHCPELETLGLSRTEVTDAGLSLLCDLPRLAALHLDHTAVTDAGLGALACLGGLRELSVSATDVSENALGALQSRLVHLTTSDD